MSNIFVFSQSCTQIEIEYDYLISWVDTIKVTQEIGHHVELRTEKIFLEYCENVQRRGDYQILLKQYSIDFGDSDSIRIKSIDSLAVTYNFSRDLDQFDTFINLTTEFNSNLGNYPIEDFGLGVDSIINYYVTYFFKDTIENVFIDSLSLTDFGYHREIDFISDLKDAIKKRYLISPLTDDDIFFEFTKDSIQEYIKAGLLHKCYMRSPENTGIFRFKWKKNQDKDWTEIIKPLPSSSDPVWEIVVEESKNPIKIISRKLDMIMLYSLPLTFSNRKRMDDFYNKHSVLEVVIDQLERKAISRKLKKN